MNPLLSWRSAAGAWALALAIAPVAAAQAVPGVLLQLRPQAPVPEVGLQREQAQAAWQRQHAQRVDRVGQVAAEAGVPLRAVGSAGSALRLDFEFPLAGPALDAALLRLRLHPDVASAVPNVRLQRHQAAGTPNDPLFARQWHWQGPPGAQASALNLPGLRALTSPGAGMTVAVVDGGVRYDHPDLQGRLLPGHDFVSEPDYANDGDGRDADATDPGDWVSRTDLRNPAFSGCEVAGSAWHGTAIAGQIAALTDNALGVAGMPGVTAVLPVRVAGKCGALLSDLLDGLRWAAGLPVVGAPPNPTPARVINLSYGGSGACDAAYQQTVDDVTAAGALLVVAGGNEASALTRPADCRGVMAVVAVRGDGAKAAYASLGPQAALAAPGGSGEAGAADEGLLSTTNTGVAQPLGSGYAALAGSSFAAPLVAGTAALLWSVRPDLTAADVQRVLLGSVRPHPQLHQWPTCSASLARQGVCNCTVETCGAGLLDPVRAVQMASGAVATGSTPAPVVNDAADDSGGGGHTGVWWGLALWVWVGFFAAGAFTRRRLPKPMPARRSDPR